MIPLPAPETAAAPRRSGWSLPRDILIAPQRAFATLADKPAWLPAYAILFLAGLLGTALEGPAIGHVNALVPLDGGNTHRSPAQLVEANRTLLTLFGLEQSVIVPLFTIGGIATLLTLIARFSRLTTPYLTYAALAANCLLPQALGILLSALVVRLRAPAAFADIRSIVVAVPDNLALFAHAGNDREVQFLGQFDPFNVWSYVLLSYGITRLTPLRLTAALLVAFSLDLCFTILF